MTIDRLTALRALLKEEEAEARTAIGRDHAAQVESIYEIFATIRDTLDRHLHDFRTTSIGDAVVMFLFVKVVRNCRGALILTTSGLPVEAEVVLRSGLEALINFYFITQQDTNERATLYAEFDYVVAKELLDRTASDPETMQAVAQFGDFEMRHQQVGADYARVRDNYPRKHFWAGRLVRNLKVMAEAVGLSWYYNFIYWFGSNQMHANARSAIEYMDVSASGVPTYKLGLTAKGVMPALTLISDFLIRGLEHLTRVHGIDEGDAIAKLMQKRRAVFGDDVTPSAS